MKKRKIISASLIITGLILVLVGIIKIFGLPSEDSVMGDAIIRGMQIRSIFQQKVICFFLMFIGIILSISGLFLGISNKENNSNQKISNKKNITFCHRCGQIQDISNNFCSRCGEKMIY